MENLVWERVLVDWVNCLKLSKPIQDLNDLREVTFFSNLNTVIHQSGELGDDVIACLLDVLKIHYPLFNLTNNYAKLSDMHRKDLSALTSLLMHYTCIHDRRDILTSPLCHQLKQITQMYIKNFLEKVHDSSSLTITKLTNVVEKCVEEIKENESNSKTLIPPLNHMIDTKGSPLQDILNTPLSKSSRFIEKGKEIAKLKCDLELALDEKETLETNLKQQVIKNKKLEKQLTFKSEEISRLRNDVLSLEERTLPYSQDAKFLDNQKILRTQIHSLEHIIEKCDQENEELRTERDALKKQVKVIEAESKAYMEKLNDTHKKLQIITEHSAEQETKFEALRKHCDELEYQLRELKRRSCNESLVDESFQFADHLKPFQAGHSYEDLAHSVVDIQLREKQIENDELKVMLDKVKKELSELMAGHQELLLERDTLTEQSKNLKETIECSNRKLETVEIKLNDSKAEIKRVTKKLDDITEEKDALTEELRSTTSRLSKYVSVSEKLEIELRKTKKDNEDISESLGRMTSEKEELVERLNVVQSDLDNQILNNKNISHQMSDLKKQFDQLKQLKEKIEFENAIASEVLESTTAERDGFVKQLQIVQEDLGKNLVEKEELMSCYQAMLTEKIKVEESLNLVLKEKDEISIALEKLKTTLDSQIAKNEKITIQLSAATEEHAETVKSLQLDIDRLREYIAELECNNAELVKNLDAANVDLHKQFAENQLLLQNYSLITSAKEDLERTCEFMKANEASLLENLNVLETKLEESQNKEKTTSDELAIAAATIERLKMDLQLRDSQVKGLFEDISYTKAKCQEQIKELEKSLKAAVDKNEDSEKQLEELHCEKEQLLVKLELTLTEIRSLRQELATVEQDMSKTIENLQSKHEGDILKIQDLNQQLCNLSVKKSELQSSLDQTLSENSAITDTLMSALLEKDNLLDALKTKSAELEKVCQENEDISKNLSSITAMYENIRESLEWETLEKNRLAESQLSLLCEKEHLMEKLNDTMKVTASIEIEKDALSKTLDIIKSHFTEDKSVLDNISYTIKENRELKMKLDSVESIREDLAANLETLESKYKKAILETTSLSAKLETSSSKLEELETSLNQTLREKTDLHESLESTVSEKEELSESLKKLQDTLKKTVDDRTDLSEKLSSLSIINKELEQRLHSLDLDSARVSESLILSESEKKDLENRLTNSEQLLKEQQTDNENLHGKLEEIEAEMRELKEQKKMLIENMESLQRILDVGSEEKKTILKKMLEVTSENEELKQEVNYVASLHEDLSSNLSNLQSKYDDLCIENNKLTEQFSIMSIQKGEIIEDIGRKQIEIDSAAKCLSSVIAEKDELIAKLDMAKEENFNLLEKMRKQEFDAAIAERERQSEFSSNLADLKSQLEKKILEIGTLSDQLSNTIDTKKELEIKLEEYKILITNSEVLVAEKAAAVQALEDIKTEYQSVISENEKHSLQIKKLNVELQNTVHEKTALESQVVEKGEQLDDVRNELENLTNDWSKQYDKLLYEKDEAIKTLQSIMSEKTNLFNELEALQNQLDEKKMLIENLTSEKDNLTKEYEAMKTSVGSINAEKELVQLEKKEISRKVKEEKDNLLKTVEKLEREKAVIENFLDLNNNEIQKLNQEKEEILNALVLSNREVEHAKEFMQKQLLGLAYRPIQKETLEDVEKLKSELVLVLNEILEENKILHGEIDKLSSSLTHNQQNVSKLERVSQEKSEIMQKVSQENKDICEVVERLSKEHSEIAGALDYKTHELDTCLKEKNQLQETVDILTQKYKQLEDDRIETLENHQKSIEINMDLSNRVKAIEKEKQMLEMELQKVREAYAKVVSTSAKFELESVNLKKKIKEADEEIVNQGQIKEAYEKLLEENNKLMTELDTSKYKRSRDREEFVRLLKRERQEAESRTMEAVKGIRREYEFKMENMKEKMKLLLKEVDDLKRRESQKRDSIKSRQAFLSRSVQAPAPRSLHSSVESLSSNYSQSSRLSSRQNSLQSSRQLKSASSIQEATRNRTATFARPKSVMSVDETLTLTRRTSITQIPANNLAPNLEMEDEDDDFNNKYLTDLKAGLCTVPASDKEVNGIRMSELAWRNSMLPPHLKSSYPAEMQFVSPSRIKEEDLKSGNIDQLDDSLCKLLPGERASRQKKDFGTTSYKKPGPPTPSKNGGRLSLQSNEIQPLRENNSPMKKVTPSRIKALFMGKQSTKENTERQSITPNRSNRRLSIFRK